MRSLFIVTTVLFVVIGTNGIHAGETIRYPGAELQTDPIDKDKDIRSLFSNPASPGDNRVEINFDPEKEEAKHIPGYVMGGISEKAEVKNNTVKILNGSLNRTVRGGYSVEGNVVGNAVIIVDGLFGIFEKTGEFGNINGGSSIRKDAINNRVIILGGTFGMDDFGGFVRGGYSETGSTVDNKVVVYDGRIDKIVYGGFVKEGAGSATSNEIVVFGGTLDEHVVGGSSLGGTVNHNSVTMFGGEVDNDIFGGRATTGSVVDNTVLIADGVVEKHLFGGYSEQGNVIGNHVTIAGGSINTLESPLDEKIERRQKARPQSKAEAAKDRAEDRVEAQEKKSENAVDKEEKAEELPKKAKSPVAETEAGKIAEAAGAEEEKIEYNVFGGFVKTGTGDASGNTITLSGGELGHNVIGGYVGGNGKANNNTINLFSGVDLSDSMDFFGGFSAGGGDATTGNAFNVIGFSGSFGNIHNFQTVNINASSVVTLIETGGTTFVDLNNAGRLRFLDKKFDTTITIEGDYIGNGIMAIETDEERMMSDKIIFRKAPVGVVRLEIVNHGNLRGNVPPKSGVVVATVEKDADLVKFELANPRAGATHHWVLERDGNDFKLGTKRVTSPVRRQPFRVYQNRRQ